MRAFFTFFIICVCVVSLNAQLPKFMKNYSRTDSKFICGEQFGSGYILCSFSGGGSSLPFDQLNLFKMDQLGKILWKSSLDISAGNETKAVSVAVMSNDLIIAASTKTDSSKKVLILAAFNSYGDTTWLKTFDVGFTDLYFSGIVKVNQNEFLVGALVKGAQSAYIFLNFNADGEFNWSKIIDTNYPAAQYFNSSLVMMEDTTFAGSSPRGVIKIDRTGNLIWKNETITNTRILRCGDNGSIIAVRNYTLTKISAEGNVIWSKNLEQMINSVYYLPSKGYYVFAYPRFYVFDESGIIQSNQSFKLTNQNISSCSDGGVFFAGKNWCGKTDSAGEFKIISIFNPAAGEIYSSFNSQKIKWFSHLIDYVNIEYSTDAGNNWNEIIRYYPSGLQEFNWTVPDAVSDICLLRIKDSFDHSEYAITDSFFSIRHNQDYDYIAANEIKMWVGNNGDGSHDPNTDGSGFYWPGGENAAIGAIFQDGLVWGGKVNGQIRFNGNTHRQGLKPGNILPDGTQSDPLDEKFGIRKIKRNWEYLPPGTDRDKYEFNYFNWPGDLGAPFIDIDGDGIFTNGVDKPAFVGDEVLFYVANDLDTTTTRFTYGSDPIGLEFQTTVFAFNENNFLKDVVFKKYKVFNKSPYYLEDFYFGYWTDDDLGNANDDATGCDTTLNLGFTYNGDNDDQNYYGSPPPAVGHLLLQGPIVPGSQSDSARFGGGWITGYKNLPMTAFVFYIGGSALYRDPSQGSYNGTLEFYNYLQGKVWDGTDYIDPTTGNVTRYLLAGDPETGTGWYEGPGWPGGEWPSDRRYTFSSGPFTFAPGDTQEVVIAIYMAQGTDNLNSVTKLKELVPQIIDFYNGDFLTWVRESYEIIPDEFALSQNYPNPFNPSTRIKYLVPSSETPVHVTLKIYDILGNEVKVLVNEMRSPGTYEAEFNGSRFASGVYFYRLTAGSFSAVKKMMLIK